MKREAGNLQCGLNGELPRLGRTRNHVVSAPRASTHKLTLIWFTLTGFV